MSNVKTFRIAELQAPGADDLREDVQSAIELAPQYGVQAVRAIKQTIRVIHATPDAFDALQLCDMDIYLGRSTPNNVLSRWQDHQVERRHLYGAVLFRCSLFLSMRLEKLALRLLHQLKENKSLCVRMANVASDGRGGIAGENTGVIYLTWGKAWEPTNYGKPTREILRKIAEAVYSMRSDIGFEITRKQLETGLETAKAPLTEKARLELKGL